MAARLRSLKAACLRQSCRPRRAKALAVSVMNCVTSVSHEQRGALAPMRPSGSEATGHQRAPASGLH